MVRRTGHFPAHKFKREHKILTKPALKWWSFLHDTNKIVLFSNCSCILIVGIVFFFYLNIKTHGKSIEIWNTQISNDPYKTTLYIKVFPKQLSKMQRGCWTLSHKENWD